MKTLGYSFTKFVIITFVASTAGGCGGDSSLMGGNDPATNTGSTNTAPTISGTPPLNVKIGETYSFTPTASDADNDTLTFSIQNKPTWAAFDSTSGKLSGSPTAGDVRSYTNISISVSDGKASASLSGFSIDVSDVGNFSITLSWTPPTENVDNSPLMDLAAYKFYYGLSEGNYPNEIYIDNPGLSSYTVQNLTANTYYFVVTAINQNGAESAFSNVVAWTAQ